MGKLEVSVNSPVSIAAVIGTNSAAPFSARVYRQEHDTNAILELTDESGPWTTTRLPIADALKNTGLAVVPYTSNGESGIRLYYQAEDLSLKEYCHDGEKWFPGEFNPGKTTANAYIAALILNDTEIQVYWRDLDGRIVYLKNTGSWESAPTVIEKAKPGYKFSVRQWNDGERIRLFNQESDGDIVELYSDDSGKTWILKKVGWHYSSSLNEIVVGARSLVRLI